MTNVDQQLIDQGHCETGNENLIVFNFRVKILVQSKIHEMY